MSEKKGILGFFKGWTSEETDEEHSEGGVQTTTKKQN